MAVSRRPLTSLFRLSQCPRDHIGNNASGWERYAILGRAVSRQHRPSWAYAVELLLQAAETGKRADLIDPGHQLARAAHADGILARN